MIVGDIRQDGIDNKFFNLILSVYFYNFNILTLKKHFMSATCSWCGRQFERPKKHFDFDPFNESKSSAIEYCSEKCRSEATQNNSNSDSKKAGCFIATAVYDNYDHPVVKDLRVFRDTWLLKRNWGVKFVNLYYNYGYKYAEYIKHREIHKALSLIFIVKPLHFLVKCLQLNKIKD